MLSFSQEQKTAKGREEGFNPGCKTMQIIYLFIFDWEKLSTLFFFLQHKIQISGPKTVPEVIPTAYTNTPYIPMSP